MRKFLLLNLVLIMTSVLHAQATKEKLQSGINASAADRLLASGYLYQGKWLLKVGDTLSLGKGTNPNHSYSYIYETYSNFFGSPDDKRVYLLPGQTSKALIKGFRLFGNKRIGFSCMAIVSVGLVSRYLVDIENAIPSSEVLEPGQRKATAAESTFKTDNSAINQIKKWKALLDDGAITQAEYDRKKNELLDN